MKTSKSFFSSLHQSLSLEKEKSTKNSLKWTKSSSEPIPSNCTFLTLSVVEAERAWAFWARAEPELSNLSLGPAQAYAKLPSNQFQAHLFVIKHFFPVWTVFWMFLGRACCRAINKSSPSFCPCWALRLGLVGTLFSVSLTFRPGPTSSSLGSIHHLSVVESSFVNILQT